MSVAPPVVRRQARAAALAQSQAHGAVNSAKGGASAAPAAAPAAVSSGSSPNLPNVGVNFDPQTRWEPAHPTADAAAVPGVVTPQAPTAADPAAPAATTAADPAAGAAPVTGEPNPYKQRYEVLRGKYNAEISSRDAYIRQQQQAIENLSRQYAAAAPPQSIPARAATLEERAAPYGWTRKDIEDFGPELVERMLATAEGAARAAMQPFAQQIQSVGQQISQTVARTQMQTRQAVYDALEEKIGADWILINDSPEFLDWVAQPDLFSGEPRQAGLMKAFESGDAARVVNVFKAFQEEDARARATAERSPTIDPATLLSPGQPRNDGSAAPAGTAERIWSEDEIGDFYARVQRGRVKPEERKQIEAQIMAAVGSGRVRPSRQTHHLLNNP